MLKHQLGNAFFIAALELLLIQPQEDAFQSVLSLLSIMVATSQELVFLLVMKESSLISLLGNAP
jgi:hypothetical protein